MAKTNYEDQNLLYILKIQCVVVKKLPKTKRLVENSRNSDFFQDLSVHSFVKAGPWLKQIHILLELYYTG